MPLARPRGELAGLLTVRYPKTRLTDMALPDALRVSLERVVAEQRERDRLREYGLSPMRKLLLVGPPGTGKTDTEGEERPLSKRWADSREIWALTGVQALDEFVKYDADLWRKASAYKGLGKSASYCFEQ